MRKYRKLGCNTIKYDGIGRLSGVASTALSLCRAWHRCLRDSSVRRKNRQRGGCKNEDRGRGSKCKLRSMNGLDEADSHSKGFPSSFVASGKEGSSVDNTVELKQVRYWYIKFWHRKTCKFNNKYAESSDLAKVPVFTCQKMALRVPIQKNGDHFSMPISPQNG